MSKITTCLWFDKGQAREAAEFYASVFPDSHVGKPYEAASDYPGGKEGDELTVEFTLLGQSFVGLNGRPDSLPLMVRKATGRGCFAKPGDSCGSSCGARRMAAT